MKRIFTLIGLVLAVQYLHAQNFTKGNIVVSRLGNGTNTLTSGALPVSIVEINPVTKTVTKTVEIPSSTAGQRLLINGNPNAGSNEGGISLSADGKYIVVGGADVALFDPDTGPDNKSFARINTLGNVDLFTINGNFFSGFIRATTSIDGSALWFTTNVGTAYVAWGATGTSRFTTTGSRYINVIGNNLYALSATNPATVLNFGTPQTDATANNGTALAGTATSTVQSGYGFAMLDMDNTISNSVDANDVLYIVDQTVASPGIIKMAYNTVTSTWEYVGKLTSTVPFYGLTARKTSQGYVELFTVSNSGQNNDLISILDENTRTTFSTAQTTKTTLASAGTNYVFRSVAFSPSDATLPLDLISFVAKSSFNSAKFDWKTNNEINVGSFILERSTDGKAFNEIKTILPNNTSGINNYQSEDLGLLPGQYYYRLKTVDKDGSTSLSNVVTVAIKSAGTVSLYPNPARDHIQITLDASGVKRNFTIFSVGGTAIKTGTISANEPNPSIDISALNNGTYILNIGTLSQTFIKK